MDSTENLLGSSHSEAEVPSQTGAEDYLAAAVSLLKQGRLAEAEVQARNALAAAGGGFDIQRTLGAIARADRRHAEALRHFQNARGFSPRDVGNLLDVGQLSSDMRDHDGAASAYSAALEIEPALVAARRGLAFAEQGRGNDAAAVDHFRTALALDGGHGPSLLGMANALKKLGRPDEAVQAAKDALNLDPRFSEAHRFLGLLHRERGDREAALAEFSAARDLTPRDVWRYLDVAAELRALGRLDEAEASCRDALAIQPELAAALRMLAFIASDRKDHVGAIAYLEKALRSDPSDIWSAVELGNQYRLLERYDEAVAHYRAALVIQPGSAEPHRQIGQIARARGDHETALAEFIAARDLAPRDVWRHLDVAAEFRALGRLDEAEASCNSLLAIDAGFAAAHRTLGFIARDRGDHAGAIRHLERATQCDPADAWALGDLAHEYRMLERHDEAIARYGALIALKPTLADPHRQIAQIARLRGDNETALAEFIAARDLAPGDIWRHMEVVAELRTLGRFDEAEASCVNILAIDPEFAVAHRTLGLIAKDRGDHAAAIGHLEKATQCDPSDAWAVGELANAYKVLERYDEALAQCRALLVLKPDSPEPHRQIAQIARLRGDSVTALAEFIAARDLAPNDIWRHMDVAGEFRALGRLDEAAASCRDALAIQPTFGAAHRMLGFIARERGDHAAAIVHLEEATRCDPSDAWAINELAHEYRAVGRHDEAIAQYRLVLALKPDSAEPHRQIAQLARMRGDGEAALAELIAARDLAPREMWRHMDVAAELRALKRFDEAAASCREMLGMDPDFAGAHRMLGFIARDRGDHVEAITHLREAVRCDPSDSWSASEIASEYRTLERFDEAVAQYYATLAINIDLPEPHRQIGMIERSRGREAAAIGHFEVALVQFERAAARTGGRALFAPIEVLLLLERVTEAEERLDGLERSISDRELLTEAHALRAQIFHKRQDFTSEIFHRREVARRRPATRWLWQALIERQIAMNMPGPALEDIAEALTHLPDEPELLIERARALRLAGRGDDAIAQLKQVPVGPDAPAPVFIRLANEFRHCGLAAEARSAAETAASMAPHLAWARQTLAVIILEQEGPAAGLAAFRRELERSPDSMEAVCQVSRLLREGGAASAARDFLLERGTDALSPIRIVEELVVSLCQCDEFDRARDLLSRREALALAGDDLLGLAIEIELASGDTKRLAALVATAQEHPAPTPAILSRIIRGAHILSDLEAVIRTNRTWIDRDPARALHGEIAIAEAEFRLGRRDQALEMLDSLEERFGDVQDLYLTRARLLASTGQQQAALVLLRSGLQKFPNFLPLRDHYVRLCIQTNQIEEARRQLASMGGGGYMMAAERDLLAIELDLELRDIEGAIQKLESLNPQYRGHLSRYHGLCSRAYLAAFDLAAARQHLAAEISLSRFDRRLRRQSRNVSQSLAGQILDDYRLDQGNVQALLAIDTLPPAERSERLFEQVRGNPDSTATAIAMLVHLRRTGAFAPVREAGAARIPRRIAQFWDTDEVPTDIAGYMRTWQDLNQGWDYELFDARRAGEFIKATCPADVLSAYYRSPDPTAKADLFRLAWLSHRGGFYADADDVCAGPIEGILTAGAELVAHQEDFGSFGNNFMGAVEGNPVIAAALTEVAGSILRGDRDMVWLATGPGMMSRIFTQWLAADAGNRQALQGAVVLLERRELTKTCVAHCQASYKLTPRHWHKGMFG